MRVVVVVASGAGGEAEGEWGHRVRKSRRGAAIRGSGEPDGSSVRLLVLVAELLDRLLHKGVDGRNLAKAGFEGCTSLSGLGRRALDGLVGHVAAVAGLLLEAEELRLEVGSGRALSLQQRLELAHNLTALRCSVALRLRGLCLQSLDRALRLCPSRLHLGLQLGDIVLSGGQVLITLAEKLRKSSNFVGAAGGGERGLFLNIVGEGRALLRVRLRRGREGLGVLRLQQFHLLRPLESLRAAPLLLVAEDALLVGQGLLEGLLLAAGLTLEAGNAAAESIGVLDELGDAVLFSGQRAVAVSHVAGEGLALSVRISDLPCERLVPLLRRGAAGDELLLAGGARLEGGLRVAELLLSGREVSLGGADGVLELLRLSHVP